MIWHQAPGRTATVLWPHAWRSRQSLHIWSQGRPSHRCPSSDPCLPFPAELEWEVKELPTLLSRTHTHTLRSRHGKMTNEDIWWTDINSWGAAVIGPRGGRRPPHYFDFISASVVMEWCSWLELTGSKRDRINRNVRHGKALTFGDREIDCCWTVSLLGGKVRFNSENVPGKTWTSSNLDENCWKVQPTFTNTSPDTALFTPTLSYSTG